ncbi:MAG: 4Fe-4S dicluster domain-containing protein [Thermoclostridium sp.]|nr:4Fe-4S dicluster domain-containing protein [Thermoclostridium sp.]
MKRKIIEIDREKCNGCGLCVDACHEGAISLVDGKAELISDEYCDGLGDCLPECPTGAIRIIERDAEQYNHELVMKRMEERKDTANAPSSHETSCHATSAHASAHHAGGCPGQRAMRLQRPVQPQQREAPVQNESLPSELSQWPVQLSLIHPHAQYLSGGDLLIAADCCAYAYSSFHKDFIAGKITVIGCPKLDDVESYIEKLTEIFSFNDIRSVTVTRMEVPCCGGIVHAVKKAMLQAGKIIPYREVVISTDGRIVSDV